MYHKKTNNEMWVNIPYFNPMGMQTLCLLIIYIYICTIFKVFLIVQIAEMDELSQILHVDLQKSRRPGQAQHFSGIPERWRMERSKELPSESA